MEETEQNETKKKQSTSCKNLNIESATKPNDRFKARGNSQNVFGAYFKCVYCLVFEPFAYLPKCFENFNLSIARFYSPFHRSENIFTVIWKSPRTNR